MKVARALLNRITPEVEARFWSKVDRRSGDECWPWAAYMRGAGYGAMKVKGDLYLAHRIAWVIWNKRDVPDGLVIDHLCRNRKCVNPSHLEPVTHAENLLRGETVNARQAAQTHCKRGHELSGDNLIAGELRRGHRRCRTCRTQKVAD